MSMTDAGLSAAIKTAIESIVGAPTSEPELILICNALGQAIVEYLKANAVVNGTVTSGAGSGGNVTGSLS